MGWRSRAAQVSVEYWCFCGPQVLCHNLACLEPFMVAPASACFAWLVVCRWRHPAGLLQQLHHCKVRWCCCSGTTDPGCNAAMQLIISRIEQQQGAKCWCHHAKHSLAAWHQLGAEPSWQMQNACMPAAHPPFWGDAFLLLACLLTLPA
jgi:hypothetical protein